MPCHAALDRALETVAGLTTRSTSDGPTCAKALRHDLAGAESKLEGGARDAHNREEKPNEFQELSVARSGSSSRQRPSLPELVSAPSSSSSFATCTASAAPSSGRRTATAPVARARPARITAFSADVAPARVCPACWSSARVATCVTLHGRRARQARQLFGDWAAQGSARKRQLSNGQAALQQRTLARPGAARQPPAALRELTR